MIFLTKCWCTDEASDSPTVSEGGHVPAFKMLSDKCPASIPHTYHPPLLFRSFLRITKVPTKALLLDSRLLAPLLSLIPTLISEKLSGLPTPTSVHPELPISGLLRTVGVPLPVFPGVSIFFLTSSMVGGLQAGVGFIL